MKISGPGSIRSAATRRAERKDGQGSGATFRIDSGATAEAAAPAGAAGAVAGVGALLALQELPATDAGEQRRQAVHRSNDILEELDQLRLGLLTGSVPRQRLQRLVKLLRDRPGGYADPQLDHIIADIELRAAVELAKMEMTEGRRK